MLTNSIQEVKELGESEDYLFKIVVVGDSAVGKSNILTRYVQNQFNRDSKSTVGVELSTKLYKIDDKFIKVNLWDTAGQERFTSITAAYYKGAKGALIVYDITRRETFDNLNKWYKEIVSLASKQMIIIMIGNKSDLSLLRKVSYEEAMGKAKELKIPFMETSAFDSSNIQEAFKKIILEIYLSNIKSNLNEPHNQDKENYLSLQKGKPIKLKYDAPPGDQQDQKNGMCC